MENSNEEFLKLKPEVRLVETAEEQSHSDRLAENNTIEDAKLGSTGSPPDVTSTNENEVAPVVSDSGYVRLTFAEKRKSLIMYYGIPMLIVLTIYLMYPTVFNPMMHYKATRVMGYGLFMWFLIGGIIYCQTKDQLWKARLIFIFVVLVFVGLFLLWAVPTPFAILFQLLGGT